MSEFLRRGMDASQADVLERVRGLEDGGASFGETGFEVSDVDAVLSGAIAVSSLLLEVFGVFNEGTGMRSARGTRLGGRLSSRVRVRGLARRMGLPSKLRGPFKTVGRSSSSSAPSTSSGVSSSR